MQRRSQYSFRILADKDKIGAMELLSYTFNMSTDSWMWKYEYNPDFDQSLVVVALNAKKIVGIAHWLPRNIKVSNFTTLKATLGADLAVHADHRRRGIGETLISFENKILEGKNIVMTFGFIEPDLVKRIHGPQIGVVAIPTSTIVYKKYLNCSRVREKAAILNRIADSDDKMRQKLLKLNVRVLLLLKGMPPFLVKLGPSRIDVEEDDLTDPDLKIEADSTFLASIVQSKRKTLKIIKNLLLGKLKVRPTKLSGIRKLYGTLTLVQTLFASR